MKTIVNIYQNNIGAITHYSVREWSINVYALERFVLESRLSDEQKRETMTKQLMQSILKDSFGEG